MTEWPPFDPPPPLSPAARRLGVLVPDPFDAEVLSIHSRVVNLLLPPGLLVSLVRDPGDTTALAIQVPGLEPQACESLSFHRRGALLRSSVSESKGRQGRVAGGPVGLSFAVSLEGARAFTGRALRGEFFDGAGEVLRTAILRYSGEEGFASLLDDPGNAFARKAGKIVAEGPGALSKLVGLGIGFTPSGDDFLTGYLMASELRSRGYRGPSTDAEGAAAALRAAIAGRLGSTTPGGRTLLYLALRGSYPCYLLRFWRRLRGLPGSGETEAAVDDAVRRVSLHGETSGLDAATGFVWFLLTS